MSDSRRINACMRCAVSNVMCHFLKHDFYSLRHQVCFGAAAAALTTDLIVGMSLSRWQLGARVDSKLRQHPNLAPFTSLSVRVGAPIMQATFDLS